MKVVVFTAIYPGVERFLPDWHASLEQQTDRDFVLCIALDQRTPVDVERCLGKRIECSWVRGDHGDTTATIRQRGLSRAIELGDAVVAVDSDDILKADRVAAARAMIESCDLGACALELVDRSAKPLDRQIGLPPEVRAEDVLPRHNVFGLSNSSFRSHTLARCLPIPPSAVFVDWYLATRAWMLDARLAFDPVPRMLYRQHDTNTSRLAGKVTESEIMRDATRTHHHFSLVLAATPDGCAAHKLDVLKRTADDVESFVRRITSDHDMLSRYAIALGGTRQPRYWGWTVAHPALRHIWSEGVTAS